MNPPYAVFGRSRGGGWRREFHIQIIPSDIGSDLPQPRRGVLRGKSPRTSRRWRLFFVCFLPGSMQRS